MIFEMLVVFHCPPRTAPSKTILKEQLIAEVAFVDLVLEVLLAVAIRFGCGWLHHLLSVLASPDIRVIERIDINGKSSGMI